MAEAQPGAGLRGEVGAEHLLDDRLRDLLAGLGEPVVALGGKPEGAVEVGDPVTGQ